MTWSADARPTGPETAIEQVEILLDAISAANDGVWASLRLARRRLEGESEHAWRERQRDVYRQLAPLLDRAGRLVADASALVQFLGEGGSLPISMATYDNNNNNNNNSSGERPWGLVPPHPATPRRPIQDRLPPIPPTVQHCHGNPREGMDRRIRTGLNEKSAVLVLDNLRGQMIVMPTPVNISPEQLASELPEEIREQLQAELAEVLASQMPEEVAQTLRQVVSEGNQGNQGNQGNGNAGGNDNQPPNPFLLTTRTSIPTTTTTTTSSSSSSTTSQSSPLQGVLARSVEEEEEEAERTSHSSSLL